ncbi:hypothetical protein Tco_0349510 [Tanacetum coccineum]
MVRKNSEGNINLSLCPEPISYCLGESWRVNPSRECVIKVEEGSGLAEGDGISVSRMVVSFVLKDPNLDVNNNDATTEAVANERSYTSLGASHKVTSIDKQNDKDVLDTGAMTISNISSPNPFTVLGEVEDEDEDIENLVAVKWTSNGSLCDKGSRIILGKNDNLVDVMIKAQTNQNNLVGHAGLMRNRPWVLLGDFNASLNIEDHSSGGYEPNVAMRDFKECVQAMEVADVNSTWIYFTWNQKPKGSNGILKKIDRIMGNLKFNDDFLGSFVIFHPYRISDHSPCVLRIPLVTKPKPKPFKFSNFLVYKEGFHEIVDSGWNVHIEGYAMYRVVKWLKGLKSPFRKLLHNHGNLHDRVNKIHIELDEAQKAIDRDPSSFKAKVEWLKAGDSNKSYFHKIVKSKYAKNRIEIVSDSSNNFYDGNQVSGAFVETSINQIPWSTEGVSNPLDAHELFIRWALPALTVLQLLSLRKLGNARINDYKPISCCNVLYKCISKIISNRVKEGLGDIVSINQSAFVPGHSISDNILLIEELMRNYHRRRGPPRCAFKVDIQKAYNTVDWNFLETILVGFGFHPKMVQWIMVCVSGASYSISINGNVHGWFKGKHGLRHGDPLSPYIFTLVMEILTLLLHRKVLSLVPSIPKSTAYFCNVPNAIKASILNSMPFAEGVLPVRYLGVPLISSRLLFRDCKILVEKLESRVNDWRNKFLSLCQGEMKKGKAKVAWDSVCMPKHEGGLGIHRKEDFNIALMANHIWIIFTHRESLWVKWVHTDGVIATFFRWLMFGIRFDLGRMVIGYNVVWFSHCIPRHAIHMWLVIQQKLKTQDRLRQWDVGPSIDLNLLKCPLCDLVPDSHDHLFFECSFSSQCGPRVRVSLCGMRLYSASS